MCEPPRDFMAWTTEEKNTEIRRARSFRVTTFASTSNFRNWFCRPSTRAPFMEHASPSDFWHVSGYTALSSALSAGRLDLVEHILSGEEQEQRSLRPSTSRGDDVTSIWCDGDGSIHDSARLSPSLCSAAPEPSTKSRQSTALGWRMRKPANNSTTAQSGSRRARARLFARGCRGMRRRGASCVRHGSPRRLRCSSRSPLGCLTPPSALLSRAARVLQQMEPSTAAGCCLSALTASSLRRVISRPTSSRTLLYARTWRPTFGRHPMCIRRLAPL